MDQQVHEMGGISRESEIEFSESLIRAFAKISDIDSDDCLLVVYRLVKALRYLKPGLLGSPMHQDALKAMDIFSPLWKKGLCLDLVAVLFAYCSIHKDLHCLITSSIDKWSDSLQKLEQVRKSYTSGFYTVVFYVEQIEHITKDSLEYFKLGLADTLITHWIPLWKAYSDDPLSVTLSPSNNKIASVFLNEASLDYFIATSVSTTSDINELLNIQNSSPNMAFFVKRILNRICVCSRLIAQETYNLAVSKIVDDDSPQDSILCNSLPFDLQIVMELIDHPELNYLEESRLTMLFHLSLSNIRNSFCTQLHQSLSTIGTTQSLPSMINITQFLLTKFFINIGNVSQLINESNIQVHTKDENWFKSTDVKYGIPSWYEESILPKIPPISKSLFTFDKNDGSVGDNSTGPTSYVDNCNMLLEALNYVVLINIDILKQYQLLNIDPLKLNDIDSMPSMKHRIIQQYFEMYFIPMMTTLLLSHRLMNSNPSLINEEKSKLMGRFLFSNCIRICEELISNHGNIVLYHLLKFISKTSVDDLVIQRISINLLNHLFFHSTDDENSVIQLCLENELTAQTLHSYINLWNDGSVSYKSFFNDVFNTEQPSIEVKQMSFTDILEYLPGYEESENLEDEVNEPILRTTSNINYSEPSPVHGSVTIAAGTNKYNAYSASSFVPSSKPFVTSTTSDTNNSSNMSNSSYMYSSTVNNSGIYTPKNENGNISVFSGTTPNHINDGTNTIITDIPSSISTPFTGSRMGLTGTTSYIVTTPTTPGTNSSASMFSSPWNGSPAVISSNFNSSKVVNTGKNYILGGHNRVKNNSRAQSIHIDKFENTN